MRGCEAMFLKKVQGPRSISLPGGKIMTRADLPDADTRRWVASRKAAVIRAIHGGLITRDEARETYDLSDEELDSWCEAVLQHGEAALKTTRLQKYRQL